MQNVVVGAPDILLRLVVHLGVHPDQGLGHVVVVQGLGPGLATVGAKERMGMS